jgi:CRP-like cAMP-binding protein
MLNLYYMSIQGIFPIEKWKFKSQSIFADLPAPDLQVLMARRLEQVYKKGEILFKEDAPPSGIYYLVNGKAKKYKLDKDGREHIIYVANSGELLGYHTILSGDNYPDSAAVMEDSLVAFIPKEDFLEAVRRSAMLSRRLLHTLSHEFVVLTNSLSLFTQKSVRERLALQLVVVREKFKEDLEPGQPVEINMSRDDLANLVGTARENVVRTLSSFKSEGILETRGRKIIVLDIKKLVQAANYG